MDQLSYPSPVPSSNMEAKPRIGNTKESSSTRSPTSVFAAAELNDVFRAPGNTSDVDDQEKNSGPAISHNRRPISPSLFCTLATDGELSTYSEDTEEDDDDGADGIFRPRFTLQRRRNSSQSIFRSTSDDHDNSPTKKKRRFNAPPLCHANPIVICDGSGDDDDVCDSSYLPIMPSTYSLASSFKNVCHDRSCLSQTDASSFTSLFADNTATIRNNHVATTIIDNQSVEAAMEALDRSTSPFSIMPRQLTHPLSFEALPILKATHVFNTDGEEYSNEN
mmetsp:Transcript_20683/g.43179  ORF Transcript_20683/g.43179 Transcript_20683/m.43179 type:complete len:278 (+) Transcript_20683:120-953(+)